VLSELERTSTTTNAEKIAYAASANEEIVATVKTIGKLLDTARRDSDTEAITCLAGRLTTMRALQQVSDAAGVEMNSALKSAETERADHEFRKIAVAVSKTRALAADAERCTSGQELEAGTTIVNWESSLGGDDELVEELLAELGLDELDVGNVDPPAVSPFL
jgi:hypothetical protein